jgi:hypothetical protein
MRYRTQARRSGFLLMLIALVPLTAWAQPPRIYGPEEGRWTASFSIGWEPSVGGHAVQEAAGILGTIPVVTTKRSWQDAFEPGFGFRIDAGYGISDRTQAFVAFTWAQAESDNLRIGSTVQAVEQPLFATFGDYQGFSIAAGGRYFFPLNVTMTPFISAGAGFQFIDEIGVDLGIPTAGLSATGLEAYESTATLFFRIGGGVTFDITERFGALVTVDLQFVGAPKPTDNLGGTGLELALDDSIRWSMPVLFGGYVKF